LIFDAGIAGLRRLPPFGLGWVHCVSRVAAWRRMRLCPSRRDSTFRGCQRVAATAIRRRRTSPVTLGLRLTLRRRRFSRRVLELLTDDGIARLVMVILVPQSQLLIPMRIALP
jgi:hypothetical protein